MNRQDQIFNPLILLAPLLVLLLLVPIQVLDTKLLLGERLFAGGGWLQILLVCLYSLLIARLLLTAKKISRIRSWYWRLFSLWFYLQFILGLYADEIFLLTGRLHIPVPAVVISGPLYRMSFSLMFIILGVSLVLSGPAWCAHFCYMGGIDDIFARRRWIAAITPYSNKIRFSFLALALVVPLVFRFLQVPAFPAVITAVTFGVLGLVIMATFSRKRGQMVHCTTWCPLGTLVVLVSRLYPLRLRIREKGCNECGTCSTSCRYGALRPEDIRRKQASINCTLCGDCLGHCSKKMLYLSPFKNGRDLTPVYLSLIAGLQAVFLAIGRV